MFATDNYFAVLGTWYVDGDFASAPVLFKQLCFIRVEANGIFAKPVNILLLTETQCSYEKMFIRINIIIIIFLDFIYIFLSILKDVKMTS